MFKLTIEGASLAELVPVAWRYRYLHEGRVNHWIVRQSPAYSSPATPGFVAIEAEPLYSAATVEALSRKREPMVTDAKERFLHELDLVAPNIRASHNNTVFTRDEIMRAFDRFLAMLSAGEKGTDDENCGE